SIFLLILLIYLIPSQKSQLLSLGTSIVYVLKVTLSTPNLEFIDFILVKFPLANCKISDIAILAANELFVKVEGASYSLLIFSNILSILLSPCSSKDNVLLQNGQLDLVGI